MRTPTCAAVRRFALVALFALAAQALLPYLHASASQAASGAATHSADCGVCFVLSHSGARALDAPASTAPSAPLAAVTNLASAPVAFAPSFDADSAGARAPPASLRLA